ncbi:hypothetical protein [Saccharothrix australiensis]|uniref:Secreted protein n=1 Tax=Saccharothrix australiensis TaxID=2072 RepID=A0A495VUA6_9PSEU|nr:hypothetical protein [Saccharothrix australiensis]RKT52966.1 hypothetical protein C8E97_1509 [Saccharothrix australiensis]
MTRLLMVLALIAGFVVVGPASPQHVDLAAVSATVDAAHLPGAATRVMVHPVQQQGHLGKPLDGVQPPVHVAPVPEPHADVVDPTHRTPERTGQAPLGERAPPADLR